MILLKFLKRFFRTSDSKDGSAFMTSGAFAYGGKGGKNQYGQGGKGGNAIAIGENSIAIGGKGGDINK